MRAPGSFDVLISNLGAEPLPFVGANISEGEFGEIKAGVPLVYGRDYLYPSTAEFDYFAAPKTNAEDSMIPSQPTFDPLLWEALPDLNLNIAQTAELCGISVRQLGYWTRQGYVTAQGKGTRRTYGLEAVRRLLAIRKAMFSGLSLRQAIRSVAESTSAPGQPLLSSSLTPGSATSLSPTDAASLSPSDAASLSKSLQSFFLANGRTRDHVGGLAIKLGRLEGDVQLAAEALCNAGVLVPMLCAGMTIYRQAEEGNYG